MQSNKIILKLPKMPQKTYPIFIGEGLMEKIPTIVDIKKYSKVFIITDQITKKLYLERVMISLPDDTTFIALPPSEKEKNTKNVQKIWTALTNGKYDRKSLILNLGGGVIGDMGAFAASTYMRGIDFINVPTTLLAQVDASVGGKTGIDFAGIKNLIGTFNQPVAVIVDTDALSTLPKREFLSGFAEIIKHGLAVDKNHFEKVTSKHPLKFSKSDLIDIITNSIQIKVNVVESDPTESGRRKVLNLGHTIGHAIESLSLENKIPLSHGEAISVGMVAEAKISHLMKLLPLKDLQIIEKGLTNADLPTSVPNLKKDDILKKMQLDKKNERGKVNFTLLKGIGNAIINQDVSASIVRQALET